MGFDKVNTKSLPSLDNKCLINEKRICFDHLSIQRKHVMSKQMANMIMLLKFLLTIVLAPNISYANEWLDQYFEARSKGDYQDALAIIKPLVESGNPTAQSLSAYSYLNGLGVPKDISIAKSLYTAAAEQGHSLSAYSLGRLHKDEAERSGSTYEYRASIKWFKAFFEGNQDGSIEIEGWSAAFSLGTYYQNGNGVIKDKVYAHMWHNISESLPGNIKPLAGNWPPTKLLALIMSPEELAEAQKLARECVRRKYRDC